MTNLNSDSKKKKKKPIINFNGKTLSPPQKKNPILQFKEKSAFVLDHSKFSAFNEKILFGPQFFIINNPKGTRGDEKGRK